MSSRFDRLKALSMVDGLKAPSLSREETAGERSVGKCEGSRSLRRVLLYCSAASGGCWVWQAYYSADQFRSAVAEAIYTGNFSRAERLKKAVHGEHRFNLARAHPANAW